MLVYAVVAVDIGWTAGRIAMVVVAVLAGAAIFAAIWVAGITIVFWAVEGRESVNSFTDGGNFLSQYPIDVYATWLQRFVTFVVPMAFVAYFPALTILDKPDPLGAPDWCRSPRRRWRSWPLWSRATCGASPCATIGAPAADGSDRAGERREGVRRAAQARPCPAGAHGRQAVAGISFEIEAGTVAGYIGPNGAGKSTTVKMLTGILVPSSGRISVAGLEPSRQRIQLARRIGVMFGQRMQLWWDLPLADSFELLRHIYKVPEERYRANLARFRELLDLDDFLQVPVRQLSLGQRVRGELTAAMLHDPEIVLLDEPTIGLDVVAKERVREFLTEINSERGVTVLLTTHDLDDIERLCSRLLVIDHGRLIYDGDLDTLKQRYGGERVLVVDLEQPMEPIAVDGARVIRVEGSRQWLAFRRDETSAARLTAAVTALAPVRDLELHEPDIEDVVQKIYAEGAT